jgi:hypothetical protein
MAKLETMIEERRSALTDHEAGTRRLNADEHEKFTRQVENFERKLQRMKEMNSDEHHKARMEEMATLREQSRKIQLERGD